MQGDKLLQQWKQAKQICTRIIAISKRAHLTHNQQEPNNRQPLTKQTNKQFLSVYDVVYRLCVTKEKEQNRVMMVYKDYKEILKMALVEMCQLINTQKDIFKLDVIRKIWDAYSDIQKKLSNMFAYLNRPFHIKDGKIEELDKTGINILLCTLFTENTVIEYELLYFKQIDRIRKIQQFSNQQILANIVDIFYKVHIKIIKNATNKKVRTIYTELYGKYKKIARQFYHKRFKILKQLNPSQYFLEVYKIYAIQVRIAQHCFVISGDALINKEFSQEFIQAYRETLLNSPYGLKFILKNKQIQVLKLIVELNIKLIKNIDGFKEQFEDFVYEQMKSYIDDMKNELLIKKNIVNYCNFLEKVIRKNQQFLVILEQSLSQLGEFGAYYKSGVEKAFINAKLSVPIQQLLAVYVDTKLKAELQQCEFQEEVKSIITIFNCVQNKDLFLAKYSQKLAKRILSLNQFSLKNHEVFISNLKMNCGMKYTERLETIITEYNISLENEPLLRQIAEKQKLGISLTVKVFSQGAWPTQPILELPINFYPKQLENANNCLQIFRSYIFSKKSLKISALQSKVRWIYYFDKDVMNKSQTCYFDTNCLQAILLYYVYRNRPNRISGQFLEGLLSKVNSKLIKQNLAKLSESTECILKKITEGQEPFYKFNLLLKTTKKLISYEQGNSQQQEKLFQQQDLGKDRQIVLDANISKFMKAKKITDLKTIIPQTIKMIKVFVPQTKDIKLAIDRLITKQILQRDEKDRQIIRYKQ